MNTLYKKHSDSNQGLFSILDKASKQAKNVVESAERIVKKAETQNKAFDFSLIEVKDGKVNARGLWEFLEVNRDFSNWIKDQIERLDLEENIDYNKKGETIGIKKNARFEYFLEIDIAKEVAMISQTSRGKQARKYFIECEKKLRGNQPKQLTRLEILELALASEKENIFLKQKLEEAKPALEFSEKVKETKNLITIADFAQLHGIGQNKMYGILRKNKFLKSSISGWNMPFQKWIDEGLFEVKEYVYTRKNGKDYTNIKTMLAGKGQVYLFKNLIKND
jgi:anti-repressor protein